MLCICLMIRVQSEACGRAFRGPRVWPAFCSAAACTAKRLTESVASAASACCDSLLHAESLIQLGLIPKPCSHMMRVPHVRQSYNWCAPRSLDPPPWSPVAACVGGRRRVSQRMDEWEHAQLGLCVQGLRPGLRAHGPQGCRHPLRRPGLAQGRLLYNKVQCTARLRYYSYTYNLFPWESQAKWPGSLLSGCRNRRILTGHLVLQHLDGGLGVSAAAVRPVSGADNNHAGCQP